MNGRMLTVNCATNNSEKQIPHIRLQGKWLENLGFKCGNKIFVQESFGELIIRNVEFEEHTKPQFYI